MTEEKCSNCKQPMKTDRTGLVQCKNRNCQQYGQLKKARGDS